jgi:signal peptidase I
MKNREQRITDTTKEIFALLETILVSLFIACLVFTYIFRLATIKGESMCNTLQPGDRVVFTTWYGEPEQGDIVIINADQSVTFTDSGEIETKPGLEKTIVKRIIAVEGQTIDIDFYRGSVKVDGKLLNEKYIKELTHNDGGAFTFKYPITVPEGYVFVMGDNRNRSKDSRYSDIGLVPEDDIVGEVVFRVLPLSRFGSLAK